MGKTEPKSKAGRKPAYPEGSVEHRLKLAPDIEAALNQYVAAQEVAPAVGPVLVQAVKEFLMKRGYLEESK